MRLTKQTGHAIRILVSFARAGGALIKVADLADSLTLTPQNVFKIVHLLSRAGFIVCARGPSGGCRLARAPGTICIGEVVRAMEETSVAVGQGAARSERGNASDAAVNAVFSDALAAFIQVLDGHTLADLAAAHRSDGAAGHGRAKVKAKAKAAAPAAKVAPPVKAKKRAAKGRGR